MITPLARLIKAVALVAVPAISWSGCTTDGAYATLDATLNRLPPQVAQTWRAHRNCLIRIVQGKQYHQADFVSALEFFEQVTGLEAHDNKCDAGRLPNENLESDLSAWDSWLESHAGCLRWNVTRATVECVQIPLSSSHSSLYGPEVTLTYNYRTQATACAADMGNSPPRRAGARRA